jgi:uncharacterized protein YggT (Ycf19 family)
VTNPFWQYWYFHLPNYVVAALIYTLFGRFLLSLFVPAEWNNYIWQFFVRLTDPVIALVRPITPGFVLGIFMPLVAAFWLYVLRFIYWLVLYNTGLGPTGASAPAV